MHKFILLSVACLFAMCNAGAVLAQASGSALGVNQGAAATLSQQTRALVVGADIFIGDRVQTDGRGLVQIKFSDQTELTVGPNSALVIDDYLIRGNDSAGKFAVNALAGTFRFVTGRAPKDRYQINTPTGTIGVRGTEFDFVVTPQLTQVLVFSGQVRMCNSAGACVDLTDTCQLGSFDLLEALTFGNTDNITGADRDSLRQSFIYAVNQGGLLPAFRVQNALRCTNRPPTQDTASYETVLGEDNGEEDGYNDDDYWYDCGEGGCR